MNDSLLTTGARKSEISHKLSNHHADAIPTAKGKNAGTRIVWYDDRVTRIIQGFIQGR